MMKSNSLSKFCGNYIDVMDIISHPQLTVCIRLINIKGTAKKFPDTHNYEKNFTMK